MKNNKRSNMNNLKKIGLSALAGSLVAFSASAGELSVTGGLTATFASKSGDSGTANDHGKGFSSATDITFSGSAETDNGWTVSGFVTQLEGMGAVSSSQMTIGMGSMGTFKVNRVGGGALNALDDKLPTAWEEVHDGAAATDAFIGENIGSNLDDGAISYFLPTIALEGYTLDIGVDYDPATGVAAGGTGSTQVKSGNGSGEGIAIKIGSDLGLNGWVGASRYEDEGQTTVNKADGFDGTAGVTYANGPVTVGYQTWYQDSNPGSAHYDAEGYSIAFAVNEDLSVSYGKIEETKNPVGNAADTTDVDSEATAFNIAYSMGSMSIKAKRTEQDNVGFATGLTATQSEISVSFAF
jgi:outer membrane protein OmpU